MKEPEFDQIFCVYDKSNGEFPWHSESASGRELGRMIEYLASDECVEIEVKLNEFSGSVSISVAPDFRAGLHDSDRWSSASSSAKTYSWRVNYDSAEEIQEVCKKHDVGLVSSSLYSEE